MGSFRTVSEIRWFRSKSKKIIFLSPVFNVPVEGLAYEFCNAGWSQNRTLILPDTLKILLTICAHYHNVTGRRTDGGTEIRYQYHASIC